MPLTQIEINALAEYEAWVARLELERWTTSRRDPDQALRELIAREYCTPAKIRDRYLHQTKG